MKVKVSKDNKSGSVSYNIKTKKVTVVFPDAGTKNEIVSYLHTQRIFWIPESSRLDDYREDYNFPFDNETYFRLALCTLHANTGVWVNWK